MMALARAFPRRVAGSMNKLEEAYAAHLRKLEHAGEIESFLYEPVKLRLADKCFYTPDFLVVTREGHLELHETKGGPWMDDARVKIKVAAKDFPFFRFVGISRRQGIWFKEEF